MKRVSVRRPFINSLIPDNGLQFLYLPVRLHPFQVGKIQGHLLVGLLFRVTGSGGSVAVPAGREQGAAVGTAPFAALTAHDNLSFCVFQEDAMSMGTRQKHCECFVPVPSRSGAQTLQ